MKREQTNLSYVNEAIDHLHTKLIEKVSTKKIELPQINDRSICVLFLSIGNPSIRARVHNVLGTNLDGAMNKVREKAIQLVQKNHLDPAWIKLDLVTQIKEHQFETLEKQLSKTRRNYFRSGIAFDDEFRLAFLEQEINGNAMVRSIKKGPLQLNEKNINHYLKTKTIHTIPFMKHHYANKQVFTFQTEAVFIDRKDRIVLELYNGELTNGIRKIENTKEKIASLIEGASYYLTNQVKEDGKFEYGYFSAFARRINTYNILRHSSSLYSMAEGYELIQDEKIIQKVKKGIDYAIREALVYYNEENRDVAFMVDYANEKEIKLGSNATAILAMSKYMEVTGTKDYLKEAQALARGIIKMKTLSGGFIHVLNYPGFEIKALNRIIYYEGEAVFALLRLYALDKEEQWLEESKKSLDYFIKNDYWKHHDHWLSYAANEITDYLPEDKYFTFGLKNCEARLNFIYHRDTTYPTFLELTMAAYKLIKKIKELNKDYLLTDIDVNYLIKTIDRRAEYQRVGYFYPEVAMYMKNPNLILDGFFIRHHSFRVRIDDVEHYLSGYVQYLQSRVPDLKASLTITDV